MKFRPAQSAARATTSEFSQLAARLSGCRQPPRFEQGERLTELADDLVPDPGGSNPCYVDLAAADALQSMERAARDPKDLSPRRY